MPTEHKIKTKIKPNTYVFSSNPKSIRPAGIIGAQKFKPL